MTIRIYQVDAFASKVFSGNPAAVCPLESWLEDDVLQSIAMENNLAETAFYVKNGNQYDIRWFTPSIEVDLCGHATLAAAFVLFNYEESDIKRDTIYFHSCRSGLLTVTKADQLLTLNFPADLYEEIELSESLIKGFTIKPQLAFKGKTDFLLIYNKEDEIRNLEPNFAEISKWKGRGVIVTAPGDKVDFVSRFFAPQSGINEDPVTGSAHTTLIPYWAKVFDKKELVAIQLSKRTGILNCRYLDDCVEITGECALYMSGHVVI